MLKRRKQPLRKCTGCGQSKDKREMIRVVKNSDGEVGLDFTGKKPGRGAYVCPTLECLEKAEKTKGLERSFKMGVSKEIYESLRDELKKHG